LSFEQLEHLLPDVGNCVIMQRPDPGRIFVLLQYLIDNWLIFKQGLQHVSHKKELLKEVDISSTRQVVSTVE